MQALHAMIAKDGFRLRGTAMSRVDGFSDVVFGFALTLIVVSLEVPHTYSELHEVLLGFFPFFVCFTFLIMVWWAHFRFFRRYGLHDAGTIVINAVLLFTVLFYAYPLKFLFSLVVGRAGHEVFTSPLQIQELMMVYAVGFTAVYACIVLLYCNAWRQRAHLDLSPLERTLTLVYIWDDLGQVIVGLLVLLLAWLLPPGQAGKAGFAFFLVGVWKTIHGFVATARVRGARERTPRQQLTEPPQLHHGA